MKSQKNIFQLVKEAYKSLNKKRYGDAVIILEKIVPYYADEPYPLFLLSLAYLFNDNFSKSKSEMLKIGIIDPDYMPFIQLEAFIKMKSSRDYESVLSYYTELTKEYPSDAHIYRALKLIKGSANFEVFQKNAKVYNFVYLPRPPGHLKKKRIRIDFDRVEKKRKKVKIHDNRVIKKKKELPKLNFKALSIFITIIALIAIAAYLVYSGFLKKLALTFSESENKNKIVDMVTIGGPNYQLLNTFNKKKTPEFYNSTQLLSGDFERAKKLIKLEKYNEALEILNKIFNSNVNYSVKERVNFLIKFIIDVDDRNYKEIEFKDIMGKSYLYRGYGIKLKGRITNLKRINQKIVFTLLVDYMDENKFTGSADVYSNLQMNGISNGDSVELCSVFISTIGKEKRIYLKARDIKKIK
ncbi:tetratricopeptide repeat protein [Spirochaetota bacterium]